MPAIWKGKSSTQIEMVRLVAEDQLTDRQIWTRLGISHRAYYYWKRTPEFQGSLREYLAQIRELSLKTGVCNLSERIADYQMIHDRLITTINSRRQYHREQAENALESIPILEEKIKLLKKDLEIASDEYAQYAEDKSTNALRDDVQYKLLRDKVGALRDDLYTARKDLKSAQECPSFHPGMETGIVTHKVQFVGKGESGTYVNVFETDVATLAELRAVDKQAAQDIGQWTEKAQISGGVLIGIAGNLTDDELDARLQELESRKTQKALPPVS